MGTPIKLKVQRHLVTGADPVINVELVGHLPRSSGLQIKDLLLLPREQNARHADNAILSKIAIMSTQTRHQNGGY
jgi:hypothetical protein